MKEYQVLDAALHQVSNFIFWNLAIIVPIMFCFRMFFSREFPFYIGDSLEEWFFKKEFAKKVKVSRSGLKDFLRIGKIFKEASASYSYLESETSSRSVSADLFALQEILEEISKTIEIYPDNDKQLLSLGNFPESFFDVYNVLIQYEQSVFQIHRSYTDLINQPYDHEHKDHLNQIGAEYRGVLKRLLQDLNSKIKPYKEERNDLYYCDLNASKSILKFENEVLDQSKGKYRLNEGLEETTGMVTALNLSKDISHKKDQKESVWHDANDWDDQSNHIHHSHSEHKTSSESSHNHSEYSHSSDSHTHSYDSGGSIDSGGSFDGGSF
ncbi:hypothetical protein ABE196_18715 [Bacillus subtilis]